jgi:hypothetical protein
MDMYLATIYISAKIRPDLAAILENQQSAITPELMAGSVLRYIYG